MRNKKKFGLIGHPISHSLSPALFRAGFSGSYEYHLIEGEDFQASFQKFVEDYDGINITAPFKEKACSKADILSTECKVIGACNVLKKTPEGILAANTDFLGIIKSLLPYQEKGSINSTTLVVGCGGAGKAAAYAARMLGNKVIILNRDYQKAADFANRLSEAVPGSSIVAAASLSSFCRYFKEAGTIIYTLPIAIPQITELRQSEIRGGLLKRRPKVILEANYRDASFTEELISGLKNVNPKISYISGTEWLINQAVEAYEIFTEEVPNIQKMMTVL